MARGVTLVCGLARGRCGRHAGRLARCRECRFGVPTLFPPACSRGPGRDSPTRRHVEKHPNTRFGLRWCRFFRQLTGRLEADFAVLTPVSPRDIRLGRVSRTPDHLIPHAPPARPSPCQDRSLSDAGSPLHRKRPGSRSALLRRSIPPNSDSFIAMDVSVG